MISFYIKNFFYKAYRFYNWKITSKWNKFKLNAIKLGYRAPNTTLFGPSTIVGGQNVYLHEYSRLQGYHTILSLTGKFIMKKYSAASMGLTVVTGNHTPIVGIPQYILAPSHLRDKEKDVIVDEDVWIGIGVTLLAGCHIGRGCVLGAKTLVTSNADIPPYAVAVGSPYKIVGVKFSIDQILEHEKRLYKPEERFSRSELESIFTQHFVGKKVLGSDNNLTSKEHDILKKTMQELNFKYPQ